MGQVRRPVFDSMMMYGIDVCTPFLYDLGFANRGERKEKTRVTREENDLEEAWAGLLSNVFYYMNSQRKSTQLSLSPFIPCSIF